MKKKLNDFRAFAVLNALAVKGGNDGGSTTVPPPPPPPIIIIDDSVGRG